MVGAEGFLFDDEGTLVELGRWAILPLNMVKHCQIVEAAGQIGMVGTEGLLSEGEGAFGERNGFSVFALLI
jgi:hypothetical protein